MALSIHIYIYVYTHTHVWICVKVCVERYNGDIDSINTCMICICPCSNHTHNWAASHPMGEASMIVAPASWHLTVRPQRRQVIHFIQIQHPVERYYRLGFKKNEEDIVQIMVTFLKQINVRFSTSPTGKSVALLPLFPMKSHGPWWNPLLPIASHLALS